MSALFAATVPRGRIPSALGMHQRRIASALGIHVALALCAGGAAAQAQPDSTPAGPSLPAVSGVLMGNFHYLLGGPREDFNQFVLDRAYLTVRGSFAPRMAYRLTSDVYQSADNGWSVRMKYAYLDYRFRGGRPWASTLRGGIVQTVTIEHMEAFWPRWLGSVAIDRHGFFQSADAGAAVQTMLPNRLGEIYAHVVNGTGFTRRETDRFKDFAVRASFTPFAASASSLLASTAVSGWVYDGATGGSPLGDGAPRRLDRDRWGVHVGLRSARVTAAVDHSRSSDDVEIESVPVGGITEVSSAGTVTSGFALVRPFRARAAGARSPFGLVGRYDRVERGDLPGSDYHYVLTGPLYDVNSRFAVALNYQEQLGAAAPSPFRGAFANFTLTF